MMINMMINMHLTTYQSFMDGFSGYNQIKMNPEDEKHSSFRMPLGVYCYTLMPFGLKIVGVTINVQ